MKKVISFALSLVMVMSVFLAVPKLGIVSNAYEELQNAEFYYDVEDGEATITGYRGDSTEIVIPAVIDGYKVAGFGYEAFHYEDFTKVTISKGITTVSEFTGCNDLETVVLPEGVTAILYEAFDGCDKLKNINLPNSLKRIDGKAFAYCDSLKEITIPNSIQEIDEEAFDGVENLTIKSSSKVVKKWLDDLESKDIKLVCNDNKANVTLSSTNYQYNGKVQTPKVVIKDSFGRVLSQSYYSVQLPAGRKNVGNYTITINFKGAYSGSKNVSFKILPKCEDTMKVVVKGKASIKAKSNAKIKYKSSNKKVATVTSKGVIKGKKVGKTTITLTSGGVTKKIKVTVRKPGMEIQGEKSVKRGKTIKLKANRYFTGSASKVKWSVNNKKVAKISSSGKLTGKKRGTVKVKATTKYKGKTYTTTFKVKVKVEEPKLSVWLSGEPDALYSVWLTIENHGSKKLTLLSSGRINNHITKDNSAHLEIIANNELYALKKYDIKGKKSDMVMYSYDNKRKHYYDEDTIVTFHFEYDGEVYQAACCHSRLYGMNKCYEIVRVG